MTPPAPVHNESSDPNRQAATRAALATIAAAAHAAHLHDDELHHAAETLAEAAAAEAAVAGTVPVQAPASGEQRSKPVLRFGGEEVALPFVHHEEEPVSGSPAMSLDLLAQAFAGLGEASDTETTSTGTTSTGTTATLAPTRDSATASVGESPEQASRGRRGRRNRSASRAQGAANATDVEHHEVVTAVSGGSAHEAKAPASVPAKSAAAAEPIILGVGVPKSEL
ncbi:hypothetical protein [Arthrobacter sp. NA-172]|uniref:hypothetical protein n=1 Tax=Arthrobacter sp. NA-172 TaxID=3367524 RepID=UPI003754B6A8